MYDIKIDESKNQIIVDSILKGLREYSATWLGLDKPNHFNFYMVDSFSKVIAGVCGAIRPYPQTKTAWVHGLWIDENYRKRGLGTNLMAHVNNFAYHKNCTTIQLEAFDFQGIAFFEKQGFQSSGLISKALAGRDKFFMQKIPCLNPISFASSTIFFDESENQEIKQTIFSGINDFNKPYFGNEVDKDFSIYIQEPAGLLIGGIIGRTNSHYTYANVIWVDQAHRGEGIGTMLWEKLESYLGSKNYHTILVGTLEFQAKPFYEKLGCKYQGTVPKWMGGYDHHWFEKKVIE